MRPDAAWGIEELRRTYTIHDGDTIMKIERVFEVEKETKNTIRYSEVAEGQPPVIGTIYVQKWALTGIPKQVKVTLEVEDE